MVFLRVQRCAQVERWITGLERQMSPFAEDPVNVLERPQPLVIVDEVLGDMSHHDGEVCGSGR